MDKIRRADWQATVSRATGILVLLAGVLLAARLCVASIRPDKSDLCIFDSRTSCELGARR